MVFSILKINTQLQKAVTSGFQKLPMFPVNPGAHSITEFAAIVKGRALSPEEAMDLQPDTDGSLSSFYPNPHRKPKNNAGDRR